MSKLSVHPIKITDTGFNPVDTSPATLDAVENYLVSAGYEVRHLDVATIKDRFLDYRKHPQYDGDYRLYAGTPEHCMLEKALEHFLGFELLAIRPGMIGIDVGSCKSVAPALIRDHYRCACYEQDLAYTPGVHEWKIGSSADSIPLPDESIDFATLHCTFEHFEGSADTGFVREIARLLKPTTTSAVVIAPLYLNAHYVNVTGEPDHAARSSIGFDHLAQHHSFVEGWDNRFGRHYSPAALIDRVLVPARQCNLRACIYRVENWSAIHEQLWIRWILKLSKAVQSEPLKGPE